MHVCLCICLFVSKLNIQEFLFKTTGSWQFSSQTLLKIRSSKCYIFIHFQRQRNKYIAYKWELAPKYPRKYTTLQVHFGTKYLDTPERIRNRWISAVMEWKAFPQNENEHALMKKYCFLEDEIDKQKCSLCYFYKRFHIRISKTFFNKNSSRMTSCADVMCPDISFSNIADHDSTGNNSATRVFFFNRHILLSVSK